MQTLLEHGLAHAGTGHPDEHDVLARDDMLLEQHVDRAPVTALDDDADRKMLLDWLPGQVGREIEDALTIPDKLLDVFRRPHKDRCGLR